jgi:hypothetical protein
MSCTMMLFLLVLARGSHVYSMEGTKTTCVCDMEYNPSCNPISETLLHLRHWAKL